MQNLSEILKNKSVKNKKNSGGATYEWQDVAARYAKELSIKPTNSWWKFFKDAYSNNHQGLLQATYSAVVEIIPNDCEKYFYKVFYNKLNQNV